MTASAVRLEHRPSGLVVTCCDTRSQYENRRRARAELERRLAERERSTVRLLTNTERRAQVVADRSAKTYTWNEQRGTVTDHTSGRVWRIRDFERGRWV